MNTAPLILVLILAAVSSSQVDAEPCNNPKNPRPIKEYTDFNHKHVLPPNFVTFTEAAFRTYLTQQKLCGRKETQSFVRTNQDDICTARGERVVGQQNLCMSANDRQVFEVTSNDNKCQQITLNERMTRVVVRCQFVGTKSKSVCRPIHFHPFLNQETGGVCFKATNA